jgi:hypothetical protein
VGNWRGANIRAKEEDKKEYMGKIRRSGGEEVPKCTLGINAVKTIWKMPLQFVWKIELRLTRDEIHSKVFNSVYSIGHLDWTSLAKIYASEMA